MAWYSGDSYQVWAAALVANLSTMVTCPADPSSSTESRSTTMFSAPWAFRMGPTAAMYCLYSAWFVIV
jgi:hypothetical protein